MSATSLLPADYLSWRKQKRANVMCAVLFGVVMAGVLAAAVASERSHRQTREVRDRVNQSYQDAEKLIHRLQDLKAHRQSILRKAMLTAALQESVLRSYVLAVVTDSLPKGSSLHRLRLETKRTTVVHATPDDQSRFSQVSAARGGGSVAQSHLETEIVVTGYACTDVEVAGFIAGMARCRLMESVDLIYSQEEKVSDHVVRKFEVNMRLRPDAQLVPMLLAQPQPGGPVDLARGPAGGQR